MTANLPAYLQDKPVTRRVADAAAAGLGTSLPPHISIQGNAFTLIDAAGAEQPIGSVMDCCIVDVSDVVAKRFYGKKWEPDSNDPPLCWSSNGVGPSHSAVTPQARTCAECPNNARGSAVSQISGVAIKACRDEKLLANLLPKYPKILFQLVITPGSFKNWTAYLEKFKGQKFDLNDVITRIEFQPKVNGVLTFNAVGYIDAELAGLRNTALVEKKTDILVGRLDRPRDATLPLPGKAVDAAPNAASLPTATVPAAPTIALPVAPTVSPSSPAEAPANGRRRKKADAPVATNGGSSTEPQTAPFMPGPSPVAPAGAGHPGAAAGPASTFGIAPGVAPNAELNKALDDIFGPS